MKTFKTALITIVVNLIFLANTTLAGGFYSRDQYNFKASSDKESIISISCSKLPYKDLIFMASLTVNSRNDVLVDSVVIKSNSLKMRATLS